MHITNVPQIIAPARFHANTLLPAMNKLEYAGHNGSGERGRAFWEPSDELVEEFFGGNLKVEWISTHLDEGIEQTDGEKRDVWIAVVHCLNDEHRSFSWTGQPR
jgi:hypothetical protein